MRAFHSAHILCAHCNHRFGIVAHREVAAHSNECLLTNLIYSSNTCQQLEHYHNRISCLLLLFLLCLALLIGIHFVEWRYIYRVLQSDACKKHMHWQQQHNRNYRTKIFILQFSINVFEAETFFFLSSAKQWLKPKTTNRKKKSCFEKFFFFLFSFSTSYA